MSNLYKSCSSYRSPSCGDPASSCLRHQPLTRHLRASHVSKAASVPGSSPSGPSAASNGAASVPSSPAFTTPAARPVQPTVPNTGWRFPFFGGQDPPITDEYETDSYETEELTTPTPAATPLLGADSAAASPAASASQKSTPAAGLEATAGDAAPQPPTVAAVNIASNPPQPHLDGTPSGSHPPQDAATATLHPVSHATPSVPTGQASINLAGPDATAFASGSMRAERASTVEGYAELQLGHIQVSNCRRLLAHHAPSLSLTHAPWPATRLSRVDACLSENPALVNAHQAPVWVGVPGCAGVGVCGAGGGQR